MSKTKEDIITEILEKQKIVKWTGYFKRAMSASMDLWAKQGAIDFHVFVIRQKLERNNITKKWESKDDGVILTDEAVWEIYLQYKEYIQSKDGK
jgi:hypothetical protein